MGGGGEDQGASQAEACGNGDHGEKFLGGRVEGDSILLLHPRGCDSSKNSFEGTRLPRRIRAAMSWTPRHRASRHCRAITGAILMLGVKSRPTLGPRRSVAISERISQGRDARHCDRAIRKPIAARRKPAEDSRARRRDHLDGKHSASGAHHSMIPAALTPSEEQP